MLAEETNYMRDFIGDEDQRIRKINFIKIKNQLERRKEEHLQSFAVPCDGSRISYFL